MSLFSIDATTPVECRDEIVKWLSNQALDYRSQARLAERLKAKYQAEAKAGALEAAAKFIKAIEIK